MSITDRIDRMVRTVVTDLHCRSVELSSAILVLIQMDLLALSPTHEREGEEMSNRRKDVEMGRERVWRGTDGGRCRDVLKIEPVGGGRYSKKHHCLRVHDP
jgi:hypothetical protein